MYLQNPFNAISYSVIGDDSSPTYFDVDNVNGVGQVVLRQALTTDPATTYYVRLFPFELLAIVVFSHYPSFLLSLYRLDELGEVTF